MRADGHLRWVKKSFIYTDSLSDRNRKYFWQRYDYVTHNHSPIDFRDKRVLEIGSGLGPVSFFYSHNFAKLVVGIDLNIENVKAGKHLAVGPDGKRPSFSIADANTLPFQDGSFDLIVADNVFEHFDNPMRVLEESFRVLSPGGRLVISNFSSILSRYGAHMKTYIKVPWCNLIFTQRIVVQVLAELAHENPRIIEDYPAIEQNPLPHDIRGVRRYNDLSDITFGKFREITVLAGFRIDEFSVKYKGNGRFGRIASLFRIPFASDLLSVGASAILLKPS